MEDVTRILGLLKAKLPPFITEEWRFWSLYHVAGEWTLKLTTSHLSCEVTLKDEEV